MSLDSTDSKHGAPIGKGPATGGIELLPLGMTPRGELVRVNISTDYPEAFDLLKLSKALGGCEPLIVGPMEFVTVIEKAQ